MKFVIDRESNISIYHQRYNQIRDRIFSGEISNGDKLPSERKIAEQLSVNCSNIV
ncbi:GntR family transcriptional regulator [Marinisporobacter balticus]|uniref:Regulatory GntR family protein n=1 Tax=Marinisporobacter balticus TaxID=2018667 RepID=A0A4R2KEU2_9FIRM|nr:GntR family transcriptional regulator [Marinisporobacter balticus]TCO72171.1 regulatory GntR family protein [Marinisporobacter balticus]